MAGFERWIIMQQHCCDRRGDWLCRTDDRAWSGDRKLRRRISNRLRRRVDEAIIQEELVAMWELDHAYAEEARQAWADVMDDLYWDWTPSWYDEEPDPWGQEDYGDEFDYLPNFESKECPPDCWCKPGQDDNIPLTAVGA